MIRSWASYSIGTVCCALLLQASARAAAPDASPGVDDGALQEVVVTAQKREQSLQDVGVAVTALSRDDLRSYGIVDSKDIVKMVPNVLLDATASGGVNANLTVRGISQSDFSSNQESPNSMYIDEVYLSSPSAAAFTLYDLDRVEVLRGPQGTLFGRNSTGGLANFITARPTDHLDGYAELGVGRFNQVYVEAAAGGPITDRVRGRISARDDQDSGWWPNYMPGGHAVFEKRFRGVRGQIEADVTDSLLARLTISYDEDPRHYEGTYSIINYYVNPGTGLPAAQPADLDVWGTGPGNNLSGYRSPYKSGPRGAFNNVGFLANRRFAPTLRLEWKRGSMTVTSITNFQAFAFAYNEDCDGGPVDYCQFPFGQRLKQWSEELRANGQVGALNWTAGLYYLDIQQDDYINFLFPALSGSDFAFSDTNTIQQRTTSVAPFGQIEWKFTDTLRLTAGARYTHDRKTIDSKVFFYELGNGYSGGTGTTVFNPPLLAYDFSRSALGDAATLSNGLVSGKLQLDYTPHPGALLYAGVSRGVKGGGFNTNVSGNLTNEATPFRPETVYAYEVGSKFDLLDRHLRIDSSVFYYDYRAFQGFAFTGLQGVVGNYDGRFAGAETEIVASLPAGVRVNVGGSYLHSILYDIPTTYSGVRDQQSILAPKWTAQGGIQKSVVVGPGTLTGLWSFNYVGDRYASVDNNPATLVRGSFVHDARIAYELSNQGLEFAASVDNISNTSRENFTYDLISSTGTLIRSYAPPRWWHLSVRKKF